MEIDITVEQLERWRSGAPIDVVMPELKKHERQFLLTGHTEKEFRALFKDMGS
jgi:hypothetical protein